ncbi:hypothetical protein SAMN05421770_101237 [Granulicella rosea]|uniref:DUF7079 domain-containing protein n=1 Tax=Granulicella rosea TaxID=474952 RepID=A0A239D3L6_9BACT|nr:hypothetical protein [Granulicella rosea]SNS26183.1 hypothetical protein SAMN05421770_101237 [Granulicella rosea]
MSVHESEPTASHSLNDAPTAAEYAARLPIWTALAQLFRDNAMHGADYDQLAAQLRGAGQTAESARHVLVHEVAPVFYEALTVKGGDGSGWPAETVDAMMREFFQKSESRRKWLRVQAGRMSRRVMLGGWEQVEQRLLAGG